MTIPRLAFILVITLFLVSLGQEAYGQARRPPSEGITDTLKRMQIKRENDEHEKLVKGAHQAADIAATLPGNCVDGRLEKAADKKLKEIEKAAKQILRSVGNEDSNELFEAPKDLDDGVKRLGENLKVLGDEMDKTSRHVTSVNILESSTTIIRLVRFLRGFLPNV